MENRLHRVKDTLEYKASIVDETLVFLVEYCRKLEKRIKELEKREIRYEPGRVTETLGEGLLD